MPISVECDKCGWSTTAKDSFAGRTVACKRCGTSLDIPLLAKVVQVDEDERDWEKPAEVPREDETTADRPLRSTTNRRRMDRSERNHRSARRRSSRRRKSAPSPGQGARWKTLLAFLTGGVVGVIAIRFLFLEPIQVVGWRLFWEGLLHGQLMDIEFVLRSETFAKCALGFLIGGAGFALSFSIFSVRRDATAGPETDGSLFRPGILVYGAILLITIPLFTLFLIRPWDAGGAAGDTEEGAWALDEPKTLPRLTITQLSDVYEESQARGNEEYAGRMLEVTGRIDRAYTMASQPPVLQERFGMLVGQEGGYFIEFDGGGRNYQVLCYIPRLPMPQDLKGKSVVLSGTCVGIILQSGILFRDCEIVDVEGVGGWLD